MYKKFVLCWEWDCHHAQKAIDIETMFSFFSIYAELIFVAL